MARTHDKDMVEQDNLRWFTTLWLEIHSASSMCFNKRKLSRYFRLENHKSKLKAEWHRRVRSTNWLKLREQLKAKSRVSGNFLKGFWLPASQHPHPSSHDTVNFLAWWSNLTASRKKLVLFPWCQYFRKLVWVPKLYSKHIFCFWCALDLSIIVLNDNNLIVLLSVLLPLGCIGCPLKLVQSQNHSKDRNGWLTHGSWVKVAAIAKAKGKVIQHH